MSAMKRKQPTPPPKVRTPQKSAVPVPVGVRVPLAKEREEVGRIILSLPKVLADEQAMADASATIITCRKMRKDFEAAYTTASLPYERELAKIEPQYKPFIKQLKDAEATLNKLITDFRLEATRKADLAQRQIDDGHRQTMDLARAQGQNPLSVPVPAPAPLPPVGFSTDKGKQSIMRTGTWSVTDETQIPYEYQPPVGQPIRLWLLNESAIGQLRRSMGIEAQSPIPGIAFGVKETVVVR